MSVVPTTPADKTQEVFYPASDGEPLAETPIHVRAIILLFQGLDDWFVSRQPDVYVGADMFWYWQEGNPNARRAPDVMVIKDVGRADRNSFFSWRENNAVPCFIAEITSEKTWREDIFEKRALYAQLGVREYFLFDPNAHVLQPALRGLRRSQQGEYLDVRPDDQDRLHSEELGLYLRAEGRIIRLFDGETGQPILYRDERAEAEKQRADAEKQRADAEKQRADAEKQQADAEKQRADAEKQQADAEKQRADAEKQRADAEKQRADAEKQRADAERQRADGLEAEVDRLRALLGQQPGGQPG